MQNGRELWKEGTQEWQLSAQAEVLERDCQAWVSTLSASALINSCRPARKEGQQLTKTSYAVALGPVRRKA